MEFDNSYFKGEEREGFFVEEKMKRAWAAQIEVLEEVRRICQKNGISYYAGYGTLLGAVRHKGFIPWDDDTDLFMIRDDYEKFCGIVQQEVPKGYKLLNIYTQPDYTEVFSRLINSDMIDFSNERLRMFHGCPYAVGVDIFPLDYLPRNEEDAQLRQDLYAFVMQVKIRVEKNEEIQEEWLDQIEDLCKVKIDKDKPLLRQLIILMDRLSSLYHRDESDEVTMLHSYVNGFMRGMKLEWFQGTVWLPFENTEIAVPQNYKECTRAVYGDNYMTPKRYKAHDYPFYAKQDKIILKMIEKKKQEQMQNQIRLKEQEKGADAGI